VPELQALSGHDSERDRGRVLWVQQIPPWCPRESLAKAIRDCGGNYDRLVMSDAAQARAEGFTRNAWVVYNTSEAATEAAALLKDHEIKVELIEAKTEDEPVVAETNSFRLTHCEIYGFPKPKVDRWSIYACGRRLTCSRVDGVSSVRRFCPSPRA
jgi:hypothetical protein